MPLPRPQPGQGKWWALAAIGISLMTALAVWYGLRSSQGITASQAGFTVVSDHETQVVWDVVTPQKNRAVTCTIEAMDIDRNVVGTKTVPLAPSRFTSTRYRETVLTTSRAVTGTVTECQYR